MSNTSENPFRQWIRLEQPRLGSEVVYASDDFFADKSRLILPGEPRFIADKYDDNGKWMDGWESRRRRDPGHDFCIVKLGVPGIIRGFDIDTRHFTGNYPPAASIEACVSGDDVPGEAAAWTELLARSPLSGDSHHYFAVSNEHAYTHIRLHIYPDGGVARLRIFGQVQPDFSEFGDEDSIDLLALRNGGRALQCSDEHFGSMHNLNLPGRGVNMGDGWETARRRTPGNDWVILGLGHAGVIERVEIDTAYFKGNYPDSASLQAALVTDPSPGSLEQQSARWPELLPQQKLGMDQQHFFENLADVGPVSHVRVSIYPDGGISRLRLFGRLARDLP